MHRLRTTFKRSRTPTGNEMKTQSSLEVPKQVRSASFDEIQLEAKRHEESSSYPNFLLKVPQYINQRSKSVDSGGTEVEPSSYLEVPRRFQRRRSSGSKIPICVHCQCVEEFQRLKANESTETDLPNTSISITDSSSSSDDEETTEVLPPPLPCSITVTLSPTIPPGSPPPCQLPPLAIEHLPDEDVPTTPTRRKSIQRQEAFFAEPTGNSLENMSEYELSSDVPSDCTSDGAFSEGDVTQTAHIQGLIVRDIYLTVPDLKRDRAASVDSCFSKVSQHKTEEIQHSGVSLEVPVCSNVALRSRSVDIVLPTNEQARYKALAMTTPPEVPSTSTGGVTTTNTQAIRSGLMRGYVKLYVSN